MSRTPRLLALVASALLTAGAGSGPASPRSTSDPSLAASPCPSSLVRNHTICIDPSSVGGATLSGNTRTVELDPGQTFDFSVSAPEPCPKTPHKGQPPCAKVWWVPLYGASRANWGVGVYDTLKLRISSGCQFDDHTCAFTAEYQPGADHGRLPNGSALRVTAVVEIDGYGCGPTICGYGPLARPNGGGWLDWVLHVGAPPTDELAVDWSMPHRLYPDNSDWGGELGLPPASFVSPADWAVDLFLTSKGARTCPSGVTFDWSVTGKGWSSKPDSHGCSVEVKVPKLGTYSVTAKELKGGAPTGTEAQNDEVVARDWLVVGLGDSNGSGQGNPPYLNKRCDRSVVSYQYQTALYLEDHDPHSSVTFLFDSCSGARSDQVWQNSYEGQEPSAAVMLPPQLRQIDTVIGKRKPDAVIMSVGINDLFFGSIMGFCTTYSPNVQGLHGSVKQPAACQDAPVTPEQDALGYTTGYSYSDAKGDATIAARTSARLAVLRNRFELLDKHLAALGAAHVFASQYPDETTDESQATCSAKGPFPKLSTAVWSWLEDTGTALNDTVAGTSSLGWIPITGVAAGFKGHGYCSSDSYFDTPGRSQWEQGNLYGSFHATAKGAAITYQLARARVCEALYGNPACDGDAPAPK